MNKIKQFINSEKFSNIKDLAKNLAKHIWAKKNNLAKYIIISLAITYVLTAYYPQYIKWYNENIMPFLSKFTSNMWSVLLTFFLIIIAIYVIATKHKMRYQYDNKIILPIFFLSIVLIVCRFTENYNYVNWIWIISYVDVLIMLCVAYTIAAIVNKCRAYYKLYNKDDKSGCENNSILNDCSIEHKNENIFDLKVEASKLTDRIKDDKSDCENNSILNDCPIEHKNEDIFDLKVEASKLTDRIKKLDRKKNWSVAITAPWGTGKTSFMNLMLENISEKDFEIVRFSPRDCKSFNTIQEEFFNSIACVLSKYDSRCSNTLKKYMASLQLIDNRGIIEKITNFYRIWNKTSLKESIKQTFSTLDKKVLVLIDDFDRLSKEEILEVLKLIDSNAAFSNLIFLTAYDKEQVNKSLGDSYKTKEACFVDKFFNLEFSIPSRPYSYISRYIEDRLCKLLNVDDDEKKSIQQTITNQITIFGKYLPTLRDAKRYINLVVLDFQEVKGDVIVDEFLLVRILKYRYPERYRSLYKKEYVNKISGKNILCTTKETIDPNDEIFPILKKLFPDDERHNDLLLEKDQRLYEQPYKHIYDCNCFENYFVNQIYSSLRIRDMRALFSLEWNEVTKKINEWVTNDNQSKDFDDYLNSFDMDKFENEAKYKRYAEMVTYVACKLINSRAYWIFMKIIYNQNIKDYNQKYGLDINSYKKRLLEILQENKDFKLALTIHKEYKTEKWKENEFLINDNDIWPYAKKTFIEITNGDTVSDENIFSWLSYCVVHKEEEANRWILDRDCLNAYLERTKKAPSFYIKNFVRLGKRSSIPECNSIVCEPFWQQIFGDETKFNNFLKTCRKKKIEKIDLAWNFWQLFKANDFNDIEFDGQGSVQEKIDNNLVNETKELNKMQNIWNEVADIPNSDSILKKGKDKYITILSKKQKELKEIQLNIVLKKTINDMINNKIKDLNKD